VISFINDRDFRSERSKKAGVFSTNDAAASNN